MKTSSKKLYLVGGAFFVAIILLIAFLALPIFYKIKSDSLELSQKKQEIDSFYKNWQNLENSKNDYQEIQNSLKDMTVFLPSDQAIDFILTLEEFAEKTQNLQTISVIKESTSQDKDEKKENSVDFKISLKGNFPDLIKFLICLESAPYFNNVKSLSIQRLKETSPEPTEPNAKQQIQTNYIESNIILSAYQTE